MIDPKLLLLANAAATWGMVGVIWFVQLVHYPLFDSVGEQGFAAYEARHARQTTWVVLPLMLVEIATAAALVAMRPAGVAPWMAWAGLAMVLAVWASTFLVQVPLHGRLASGFDARAHALLVGTNWVRTALWTARGALAAWMLWLAGRAA